LDQSNEEITARYAQERQRLKTILQFKQQGKKRPSDVPYLNTLVMNLCRRELEHRGLPESVNTEKAEASKRRFLYQEPRISQTILVVVLLSL
jgi:hypothetical protein